MKTLSHTFTIALLFSIQILHAQNRNFNATTMVGVDIVELDSIGNFVQKNRSDLHCLWSINQEYTQLYYSEYFSNGVIRRSLQFEILSRTEEAAVRRLSVKSGSHIFTMLFWKTGDRMVVYEFGKSAVVMTGEVEY
jgi:hypothetical protein